MTTQTEQPTTRATLGGLPNRLRTIARLMLEVGADMDYFGGFGEMGINGRQMIQSVRTVTAWADQIEAEHQEVGA